jgi:RNA polymerase sigma-70 factor, ECF subfamily
MPMTTPSPDPLTKTDEFAELLRCYGDLAYRMAFQLTGGKEDEARDLVQDGFIKIWRYWAFQRPRSFKGWMYRLLHNLYMDKMRRQVRQATFSMDAIEEEGGASLSEGLPELDLLPQERLEQDETRRIVARALATLEIDLRIPVTLCDMEGLSYEEIARVVSCPIGTVRSRIHRGREKLRALLVHLTADGGTEGRGDREKEGERS